MPAFAILGDGAQAREAAEYARPDRVLFYAVGRDWLVNGDATRIDISIMDSAALETPVIAGVGAPGLRRKLVEAWGGVRYRSVIAASSWVASSASLGAGLLIAPQASVGVDVVIGDHALVNLNASISHDCSIGRYATISPGARIAGAVTIGEGVFIGAGATISNGVTITAGSVIGAGTTVLNDIVYSGVYVGVPARWIRDQEDWLDAI